MTRPYQPLGDGSPDLPEGVAVVWSWTQRADGTEGTNCDGCGSSYRACPDRPDGCCADCSMSYTHRIRLTSSATCSMCGRKTWDVSGFGYECLMPDTSGRNPCGGTLVRDPGLLLPGGHR